MIVMENGVLVVVMLLLWGVDETKFDPIVAITQ